MSFELRFSPEADETYQTVTEQLRERWGNRHVTIFENKVLKALTIIQVNPYLYPVANENLGVRKCVLHKNCSVFYKVYEGLVLIAWFWDNRQDPLFF